MSLFPQKERALVTGGAGLIGSHLVDLLQAQGWSVRILDNLEPQTHRGGKPPWLQAAIRNGAEFVDGDMRNREVVESSLDGIDVVFHQAAYGGYMPEISKYVAVNSFGTAQLLEIIREKKCGIRKIVVASSQVVYPEGAGECPHHGLVFPGLRPVEQLRRGDFSVRCPACQSPTKSVPTPEYAPIGGETVYAITKVDQEKLVLTWGRQVGLPTVALRYSCTFGPRQSIFNPYTGVVAIFCTRLLNDLPPVIYEDGEQTRDFSFVEDIARANFLAATSDELDGKAVNVGSGRAATITQIAGMISDALQIRLAPIVNREFRPGEMRHLISDTTVIRKAGYTPTVGLEEGIERYLEWIRQQGSIKEYFSAAELVLRKKAFSRRSTTERPTPMMVCLVIPALNEAEVIGEVVRSVPRTLVNQIIVVDNGSTDGTALAAQNAGAIPVSQPTRGYGRACQAGFNAAVKAGADIVVFIDGDGSDCPEFINELIHPIQENRFDFVIGSRTRGVRERGSLNGQQIFAARLAGWLLRVRYGVKFTDMSPFRAIRSELLRSLPMREETYGWNLEMQMLLAQMRARILEIPVNHRRRRGGVSKVSGSFKGTILATCRIAATFFRVAFSSDRSRSTVGRE